MTHDEINTIKLQKKSKRWNTTLYEIWETQDDNTENQEQNEYIPSEERVANFLANLSRASVLTKRFVHGLKTATISTGVPTFLSKRALCTSAATFGYLRNRLIETNNRLIETFTTGSQQGNKFVSWNHCNAVFIGLYRHCVAQL